MKRIKEAKSIEYRINDKQIIRDMEDARLPIDAEASCAGLLERMVGCRAEQPRLVNVLHHARHYLQADAWEYHHSIQTGEHVFRFHLPNDQGQTRSSPENQSL
jgi:hypothetical protein